MAPSTNNKYQFHDPNAWRLHDEQYHETQVAGRISFTPGPGSSSEEEEPRPIKARNNLDGLAKKIRVSGLALYHIATTLLTNGLDLKAHRGNSRLHVEINQYNDLLGRIHLIMDKMAQSAPLFAGITDWLVKEANSIRMRARKEQAQESNLSAQQRLALCLPSNLMSGFPDGALTRDYMDDISGEKRFNRFCKLPNEVQYMVWEAAVQIPEYGGFGMYARSMQPNNRGRDPATYLTLDAGLWGACRKSRSTIRKAYNLLALESKNRSNEFEDAIKIDGSLTYSNDEMFYKNLASFNKRIKFFHVAFYTLNELLCNFVIHMARSYYKHTYRRDNTFTKLMEVVYDLDEAVIGPHWVEDQNVKPRRPEIMCAELSFGNMLLGLKKNVSQEPSRGRRSGHPPFAGPLVISLD